METRFLLATIEMEYGYDSFENWDFIASQLGEPSNKVHECINYGKHLPIKNKINQWLGTFQNQYAKTFLLALLNKQKASNIYPNNNPPIDLINRIHYDSTLSYIYQHLVAQFKRVFAGLDIDHDYGNKLFTITLFRNEELPEYTEKEQSIITETFKVISGFGAQITSPIWQIDKIGFTVSPDPFELAEPDTYEDKTTHLTLDITSFAEALTIETKLDYRYNYEPLAQLFKCSPSTIKKWYSYDSSPNAINQRKMLELTQHFSNPQTHAFLRGEITFEQAINS